MKLIVEMEMPTGCANCPMADDDSRFCKATKKYIPMLCKPSWCPIKGVLPDEHGDLIDRDILLQTFQNADYETYNDYCEAFDTVEAAETVISAERKDDEQIH